MQMREGWGGINKEQSSEIEEKGGEGDLGITDSRDLEEKERDQWAKKAVIWWISSSGTGRVQDYRNRLLRRLWDFKAYFWPSYVNYELL